MRVKKRCNHDHDKWEAFKDRCLEGLDQNMDGIKELLNRFDEKPATFVFSINIIKLLS
jgi:uncharacterized protein YeaO (DUF488 family)